MNNKLIGCIAFVAGAAVGSVVTWKLVKTKYDQLIEKEVSDVVEAFTNHYVKKPESTEANEPAEEGPTADDKSAYDKIIEEMGYNEKKGGEPNMIEPYVISPEEFGENDYYDTVTLTYYNDRVLADEWDEIIEDVDDLVGLESLNHFGDYEEDAVHVRNEREQTDYEILLDLRNYSDAVVENAVKRDDTV